MKKILIIIIGFIFFSCFKEPRKLNIETIPIANEIEATELQTEIPDSIITPTISENYEESHLIENLITSLTELENLLNSNTTEFTNWCDQKGYKYNEDEMEHCEYIKSKNEYIIKDFDNSNEKRSFSIYTFDEKFFYQIKQECKNKEYVYVNSINDKITKTVFYSNENYKIMFSKYIVGNYCISIYYK